MNKKFCFYIGLILLSINIVNGNLFSLYSYIRQRHNINTISPEKFNICKSLQNKLEDYTYNFNSNISISILEDSGDFIVDINGEIPRIPASNQKILSSAFSLDILGPYYTLNTSLNVMNDGGLYIEASGDPDFNKRHLEELINDLNNTNYNPNLKIPIVVKSSNPKNWWPSSWSYADRKEEYGAPITKYSIASNASINSLNNPIDHFIYELENALRKKNLSTKYFVKSVHEDYPIDYISTIKVINSAPLYILLNLVNSESHNFTSEVIFRHSLNDWSHDFPNLKYSNWINDQNFNSDNFIFADASGLSRMNRVTTYGLSQFLRRMKLNRFSDYYFSSFSLLGVRGSLTNVNAPVNLKGRILAKSGRLNNVRSVSGIILGDGKVFSIIVNNMDNSTKHIMNILSIVDNTENCN
ncbi:D-alanyl-D-alanine carboxypeptidase [Prochlorococcus marinus]|uniref:D-alanyl-D-alanine carboxypeptidase n=1 Tax=Prochlorococcus marinus TaxID=1219 RepID=UPI0022B5B4C9|nr:D-alanyl-D-alanine carboxypeptidase [Prochlorococcus marinus]